MSTSRRSRRSNAPPRSPYTPTPPPARVEAGEDPVRPALDVDAVDSAPQEHAQPVTHEETTGPLEHSASRTAEPAKPEANEPPIADDIAALPRTRFSKVLGFAIAAVAALALITGITGAFARSRRRHEPTQAPVAETFPTHTEEPALPQLPELEPSSEPVDEDDAGFATDVVGAKREALVALDAWRLNEAIAAGERAVVFDKNDGEAWLILGAAYQVNGQMPQAKRCYETCVKQGRVDPRGECAAMLQ